MRSHHYFRSYLAAFMCGLIACIPASAATIVYPAGTTIIFTPSSTFPGMRLAPVADDPSTLQNGDIWYKTGVGFRGRSEGATITLGSGSGSGNALTTDPLSQFAATTSAQLKSVLSDELGDASGKAIFALGTLAISSGKTLTSSNTLTLAGTDGSTLNIGAGGTLGAAALLGTSAGGNGTADNGKAAIFGTGGIFDATTEITVHSASTAAHAYISDDGTIGIHLPGETNDRQLVFPSTDVLENEAEEIATKEWVTANAAAFDATAVDAVTWSDGANSSNVWTFNVSGTDPTFTAGSNNFIFGSVSIDLGWTGVRLSQDGDGALTFLGLGNGSDEDLTLNFDDTSNSIVASSSTGAGLDLSGMAAVNIGTLQGTEGSHLHVIYSSVGSGTAYTMTAAYAAVDMGTTDPSVTIAATGTYRIYANIQVAFSGASYAALDEATFKLRRTNNTAADLTDGERGTFLPIMTTTTRTGPSVTIGPIEYTTTNTDDVIVIQGDLNATPSAGTITVTKATIFAERVRQ